MSKKIIIILLLTLIIGISYWNYRIKSQIKETTNDKELINETVENQNTNNISKKSKDIMKIEEIPISYSKEDALRDGCFVIEKEKIISNESNLFESFIEKANNGENEYIRICNYDIIDNITIIDIESKNGIINMEQFNITQPDSQVIYNSGTKIEKNTLGIYWLIDAIGNKKAICSINNT